MTVRPSVSMGATETEYRCECGWTGLESVLEDWDVQPARDRVVRVCPGCGASVPEWGCLGPIDGVRRVADADLEDALADPD